MNECQHKGCQNRAERTIWPDNGAAVRLCEGHAQRDIVNLDNGRTLWWTDWNGWSCLSMNTVNHGIIGGTKYAKAPGDGGTSRRRDTEGLASMRDNRTPNSTTESIPYGYCHCGCGEKTSIATESNRKRGYVKGEPVRYVHNHHPTKRKPKRLPFQSDDPIVWIVPLTQGHKAIVDADIVELISDRSWYFAKGYAACKNGELALPMHRLIMGTPDGMDTDHINGDKLDNRKVNLRICSRSQNKRNSAVRSDSASGLKGVQYLKETNMWRASILAEGRRVHLGYFEDAASAAMAYDDAAKKHFGEYARLNFPDPERDPPTLQELAQKEGLAS